MNTLKNMRFVLIDDDVLHNKSMKGHLTAIHKDAAVATFTDPMAGIEHLRDELPRLSDNVLVFINIEMSKMAGWSALDALEQLFDLEKNSKHIELNTLTCNVDTKDMQKVQNHKYAKQYLVKPLNRHTLDLVIHARKESAKH